MRIMEYRGWVKVPGINVESDEAEKLLGVLEERHGSYGPVMGGAGDGVEVILAVDEPKETDASAALLGVVTDALITSGMPMRPASIELEPA